MIPKIIHFIWLGPNEIPYSIINSWDEMHPDYEIKIWNEENIKNLGLKNMKHWNTSDRRYNQKSDIARYEILKKYGGFYVDMDIFCINKIKNLNLGKDILFYCCFEKRKVVSNSFIGSVPNHKLLDHLIDDIYENYDYDKTIWKCTGPLLLTKYMSMYYKNKEYKILLDNPSPINLFSGWSKYLLDDFEIFCNFIKNEEDISNATYNKDLQYKWDKNNIIGIQIWLGGKPDNYKKLLKNVKNIKKNILHYINTINNKRTNIFKTDIFRSIQ